MLDEIIRRMEADPEGRFTGEYFKDRVACMRKNNNDLNHGLLCGYITCLKNMKFITAEEWQKAYAEISAIFMREEQAL